MDWIRTTFAVLAGAVMLAVGAVGLEAQAAYTYLVRDAETAYGTGEPEAVSDADFAEDRMPMRVVQGPELAWLYRADFDRPETLGEAALVLHRNTRVEELGPVLVRGWVDGPAGSYDSVVVRLRRGGDDRQVAGRSAEHYELEAYIERTRPPAGRAERFRVESDVWVLPEVPFSWAPFGFGTQALPAMLPKLRKELEQRLDELGLVGRAINRVDYTLLQDGQEAGGSQQVIGFEIADLERAEVIPAPGPMVERGFWTALEQAMLERTGEVCVAAVEGELPADLGPALGEATRSAVLAFVAEGCRSPEVYFGLLEEQFEADPEGVCRKVLEAESAGDLAERVFSESQRSAYMELVDPDARAAFFQELTGYCQR